ncbi:MAG: DUF2958 domain-containing protein [Phycisphaerae bacterium]|nr:DUF2958 domain-containing protein [Phycisphaerae bacterium]
MAWRPNEQFIEGILDNTVPGKVTGWMRFTGIKDKVIFDLEGDFHRDIRGAKVRLRGDGESANAEESARYMEGFSKLQKGNVGDMTAGREPADYVNYGYFEWYGDDNGRVVIELEPDQVEILTQPIPACESDPLSRKKQAENMANFLCGIAAACNMPESNAIAIADTEAVERAKKVIANDKIRGMKLLPKEIREQLPPLYSQDGKGGKAVVYTKYFTPSSSWTWLCTEGEPVLDESGKEVDFKFFGLVFGHEREFGYFLLSELEEVRGPMGLPIERDLHFKPKMLAEIAPEMFRKEA